MNHSLLDREEGEAVDADSLAADRPAPGARFVECSIACCDLLRQRNRALNAGGDRTGGRRATSDWSRNTCSRLADRVPPEQAAKGSSTERA